MNKNSTNYLIGPSPFCILFTLVCFVANDNLCVCITVCILFTSDSINDHHFHKLEDGGDLTVDPLIGGRGPLQHNSMVANERLPGPLPLKERKIDNVEDVLTRVEKPDKDVGMVYMSQLRRPQFPMVQLCRRTHRTARNHFRRHADIKQRGVMRKIV